MKGQLSLPSFEGQRVDEVEVRLTGKVPGALDHKAMRLGKTVYFAVEAVVVGINHDDKANRGLVRAHKLEVSDAVPITDTKFAALQVSSNGVKVEAAK